MILHWEKVKGFPIILLNYNICMWWLDLIGLNHLMDLFQPKRFRDSNILKAPQTKEFWKQTQMQRFSVESEVHVASKQW